MEVRFPGPCAPKTDVDGDPGSSFSQKPLSDPHGAPIVPAGIGVASLDALATGLGALGEVEHDEPWAAVRDLTLELVTRVALHDAPAAGSKDELLSYCLALRLALASAQGFAARKFGEIETERIHRKATAKAVREVLADVGRYVKHQQWFTAYDALNAFLMSALSRAA